MAKKNSELIKRAAFVSGRDEHSVASLVSVLEASDDPTVSPEEVQLVRDPVLSYRNFSDSDGRCWRQGEGQDPRSSQPGVMLPCHDASLS